MSKTEEEHLADAHADGDWRSICAYYERRAPQTVSAVIEKWTTAGHPITAILAVMKEWENYSNGRSMSSTLYEDRAKRGDYSEAKRWLNEGKTISDLEERMRRRFGTA